VHKFLSFAKALGRDESGATAIEYGLLAALIAVVIIGAVMSLGGTLRGVFRGIDSELTTSSAGSGGSGGATP
jgi:pilus assembly protein Flp/PilA